RLRWWHVVGALSGLGGTVLILLGNGDVAAVDRGAWLGYLAAFGAAFTWGGYSVLNRRFAHVPTNAVGPFLWVAAALALVCHALWEVTVWPDGPGQWAAIIALGLGPAGGVFFLWDYAVKHGDIRVLGGLAYTTPLMSTALLVVFGRGVLNAATLVAAALIICGALLASKDLLVRRA
ncbi:MAG TPA: EamA family transporter, partial [Hydrogenophaga sp.]